LYRVPTSSREYLHCGTASSGSWPSRNHLTSRKVPHSIMAFRSGSSG
jgi:hypothetical protein